MPNKKKGNKKKKGKNDDKQVAEEAVNEEPKVETDVKEYEILDKF